MAPLSAVWDQNSVEREWNPALERSEGKSELKCSPRLSAARGALDHQVATRARLRISNSGFVI